MSKTAPEQKLYISLNRSVAGVLLSINLSKQTKKMAIDFPVIRPFIQNFKKLMVCREKAFINF